MKELVLNTKTNSLFNVIESALQIKKEVETTSKASWLATIITPSLIKNLQTIVRDKPNLKLNNFAVFLQGLEDTLQAEINLKQKENYQESTDRVHQVYWKILQLLTDNTKNLKQRAEVLKNTLVYLKYFEFLGNNNFSVIKVASIIYSLSQSEPLDAADMLVFLNRYQLLNEESLEKIRANRNLNIKLFTRVIEKLSLSGGTDHLLLPTNLDKLLDNSELNLKMLAYFIQVDDESKILTQEKFDLAINLKNLLTKENIDQLIGLKTVDFEKIVPVLVTMHKTNLLNQDNFLKFLDTFLNASIYDVQKDRVDGVSLDESGSFISLVDRLCSTLVDFLSRVEKFFQEFFDDILKYFNGKTEIDNNTIINQTVNTDSGVSSRASLFGNSSQRESINKNEELTSNIVNSR